MKRGDRTRKIKRSTINIPPRAILNYFSQLGYIKQSTAKKAIEDARAELSTTHTTWLAELSKESQKWPLLSEDKLEHMVKKAMTKKYRERDSPMFSAAELCGVTMRGHRKKYNVTYKSVKKGNTCVWRMLK